MTHGHPDPALIDQPLRRPSRIRWIGLGELAVLVVILGLAIFC